MTANAGGADANVSQDARSTTDLENVSRNVDEDDDYEVDDDDDDDDDAEVASNYSDEPPAKKSKLRRTFTADA